MGRGCDPGDSFVEGGLVLTAAKTEGEGEVAGADEEDVDAGSRGDGVDLVERGGFLDHADGHHVLVGGVVVVASRGPSARRQPGPGSTPSRRRIAAGRGR